MNLVINASPIIFLAKLGIIHRMPAMFESLVIPQGVKNEIIQGKDEAARWMVERGSNFVRNVEAIPSFIAAWDLGKGESEVLAFAKRNQDFTAAIDDKAARNCAKSLNLKIIGTIGLILMARRKDLIDDAVPHLNKLCELGYRIDDAVLSRPLSYQKIYKRLSVFSHQSRSRKNICHRTAGANK